MKSNEEKDREFRETVAQIAADEQLRIALKQLDKDAWPHLPKPPEGTVHAAQPASFDWRLDIVANARRAIDALNAELVAANQKIRLYELQAEVDSLRERIEAAR